MKDKITILNSNRASQKDEVVENLHRYNSEPFCRIFCAFVMKQSDLAEEVKECWESTRWDGLKSLFGVIKSVWTSQQSKYMYWIYAYTHVTRFCGAVVALATSSLTHHSTCSLLTLSLGHSSSTALFALFKYDCHSCFLSNWDSSGRHFHKKWNRNII